MKHILLISFVLMLSSCSIPSVEYVTPKFTDTDFPVLNEIIEAEVGDRLIEQSYLATSDGILFLETGQCLDIFGEGIIFEEGISLKKAIYEGQTAFCGKAKLKHLYHGLTEYQSCLFSQKEEWYASRLSTKHKCESISFASTEIVEPHKDALQRTLYYKGISKNNIFLDYREFFKDMARPAYTQELTFDLSQGNEIGFRGMRLEIISASNTGITYLVSRGFD